MLTEVRVCCVSWSGAFTIGGFECCNLLWCNTGATDKSELMNGKLLLMIVKIVLSPHVVSGHLSATEMDLQDLTHSHTSHALISCFPVAVATNCRISFLLVFFHCFSFSLLFLSRLYPTFCLLLSWANPSLISLSLFFSCQLTKKVKDSEKTHRHGLKALTRPLPSTWFPMGAQER